MSEPKKVGHAQHLKAVNHPIRREILKRVYDANIIARDMLLKDLMNAKIIEQEDVFDYNMQFLIQAQCVKEITENGKMSYQLLPGGKVIENFS
jgi:DNA-binding transcriptional ArsR family regulator